MVGFFMMFNETEEIDAGDVDADEAESPVANEVVESNEQSDESSSSSTDDESEGQS